MAELLSQERLQPSLLDRLIDDEPANSKESSERRVLSKTQLRQAVLRDLQWLLNSVQISPKLLVGAEHVKQSVVNFGLPALAGETATQVAHGDIEDAVRVALVRFEPRIDSKTLEVKVIMAGSILDTHNVLQLQIRGQLWSQPVPLELVMKAAIDLETGQMALSEGAVRASGRGATS
jgi:type VI secretion system protein ImpF